MRKLNRNPCRYRSFEKAKGKNVTVNGDITKYDTKVQDGMLNALK
ncbi:MAG TPA: hypothetical protein PK648_14235 [Verrucomicrobiales bacterium]|jgi:hypothetical protein|nr:hypothetical protein [Verrucomicrobiales bacterium]